MKRKAGALAALALSTSAVLSFSGPTQALVPDPTPPDGGSVDDGVTVGHTSSVVPLSALPLAMQQQIHAAHADDTPEEQAAQALSSDPSCYPQGTEIHSWYIRYEFDANATFGATAGSYRVDKVWHDDCYQVLGELRGPGLAVQDTTDLTAIGWTVLETPSFPAEGVYEWHKYKSDVAQAENRPAFPQGMHSYKRTARFAYRGTIPSPFSHNVTIGLDSYAGKDDYLCWFREDVDDNGNQHRARGEGCFYIG